MKPATTNCLGCGRILKQRRGRGPVKQRCAPCTKKWNHAHYTRQITALADRVRELEAKYEPHQRVPHSLRREG